MSCSYAEGLSEYHDKGKLGLPEKFDLEDEIRDKVEILTKWIREARHIVVHTGAGISTSAGIPDFRGPRGVWTLERRGEKPDMNLDWDEAVPTPTHMALARLVEVGKVKFIITQNIDGLHLRSGVPRRNLAELHGNMFTDQCDKCKRMFVRDSPAPTVGQKFVGSDCPSVRSNGRNCRGKLKDFVLDWEHELPETDLCLSDSHSVLADLSIVMGSTLQIIPAGNMPTYAKKYHEDGRLVICNLQPTKQDKKADLNIHTYVDDVMRAVMRNLDLDIPEYDRTRDPVRRVARGEWEGVELCVDWTQAEEEAKAVKKLADTVHDDHLRRRRELKKRKSEHGAVINKRIKREDFEEQASVPNKSDKPASSNGRKYPGMEDAGVTGSLGLLDTQEMWQGVAGEKQEAAHGGQTFTFPPDQEVAMLLDQAPIISFQQPVSTLHASPLFSDTVIMTRGGAQLPSHSLVLAAASSMMKHVFEEVQDKLIDSQFTVLMPDHSLEEVAESLQSVYGITAVSLSNPLAIDFNIGDINSNASKASEKVTSRPHLEYHQERPEEASLNSYVGHSILDEEPLETRNPAKRKRGRPKKTKHGYLNDDFIDDHEDAEWNGAQHFIDKEEKPKKKRGRPKKIKDEDELEKLEELEHYDELEEMEETILEPVVKVKEEEIERSFHEFNEFFSAAPAVETKISFNQDDTGLFQCEASGCEFSTFVRASIQQHVRQTHSGVGYQPPSKRCPSCGEDWANEAHFSRHVASNECSVLRGQDKPYVCELCGEGWYNLTNLTRHIESGTCRTIPPLVLGSKNKCASCELQFFSLKNREVHVRKSHLPSEETSYRCAKCDMNFVTHKEFNVHKKAIHGSDVRAKFQCRIVGCSFETDKRDVIAEHTKTQHRDSVHICSDCGRNFADNQKLLQHQASHARSGRGRKCLPAIYPCSQCPREFNRKRHMELHMLFKHSTDRPYSCQECGKKFKTRHCVNIHLRSHGIGGYSWCCEECGKTFNQISAYHVHLKVHSNIRDFACEDCGMTFKLKHSLKKHQLVHKTEFGHTCDFCGKKFKRSDNLINHRRRHTGEHPYKCDKCSWTGPDSSSFIHHKKKHNEPVTNVHQDTKHGPFTNMSQVDFKPQVVPPPSSPGAGTGGQEELKPIVTSTVIHSAGGQEIKLLHTIQTFKHST